METLQKLAAAFDKIAADLPQQIGTLAVNFSKQRFVSQNWHDKTAEPWQRRTRKRRGGEKRQKGAVLVDSGRLKRSIRITSVTKTSVTIGTDVEYAKIHNDGFDGVQSVRAHTRKTKNKTQNVRAHTRKMKMPQRRFFGESAELERLITEFIENELKTAIQ